MTHPNEAIDVMETMFPASWRGIEFPVSRMRASLAHDLVEHKTWGRDGAKVEDTGLAPLRLSFTSPMLRGITPGRTERWGELYPRQFMALLAAFRKTAKGSLHHPQFATILCKAERMEVDWDAARRGGCDVELSFVETLAEEDEDIIKRGRLDDPTVVETAAATLEKPTTKADLKALLRAKGLPLPPYLADKDPFSFTDAINSVKKVLDYPSLLERRVGGKIDSIAYQLDRVADSAKSAKSALTWPITAAVERSKASLHDMQGNLLAGTKRIGLFTVPADTTLAGVARQIRGAKVGDLAKLNPELVLNPEIPRGTIVRHYLEDAA